MSVRFAARTLFVLGLFSIGAISAALAAESTTGAIVGAVSDNTGLPITNANVAAASPSGRYSAVTDARGHFTLLGVTPDTYVVSVRAARFEPASQAGITVLP